jgi:hypothetical protein
MLNCARSQLLNLEVHLMAGKTTKGSKAPRASTGKGATGKGKGAGGKKK